MEKQNNTIEKKMDENPKQKILSELEKLKNQIDPKNEEIENIKSEINKLPEKEKNEFQYQLVEIIRNIH